MKRYDATDEVHDEPLGDSSMVGVDSVDKEDSKAGFPDEFIEPMRGLLFLGCLSKNVLYAGHDFLIETLNEGDVLRVGQLMSDYRGTLAESEAKKVFIVAAAVKAVDGYRLFQPYSDGQDSIYEASKTVMKWYPPVVDYIYRRYLELEATKFEVANALKK